MPFALIAVYPKLNQSAKAGFGQFRSLVYVEVVSKLQIMFESKASRGLKTERTRKYVSISIRGATQLSDIRWAFETTSRVRW
jgi:hypothetical protein